MADKPILFSGSMVSAILDGRKTQTRRVVRDVPDRPAMDNIAWPDGKLHDEPYLDAYCGAQKTAENPRGMTGNWAYWTRDDRPGRLFKVGFIPGDRLWVREAFCYSASGGYDQKPGFNIETGENSIWYRANEEGQCEGPWRPSIFMPRWASRLTLIVTDVRVQRLQEISEADGIAEGAPVEQIRMYPELGTARHWFQDLWDSLNAKRGYGWTANPWVCAVSFTTHRQNIDSMEAGE